MAARPDDPHADENRGERALGLSIALNVAVTTAEGLAGALTGSLALLADALHNLSDVVGLVLAWAGVRIARRGPTPRRTFGLLRAEPIVAFVNALVLLPLAGGVAWAGIQRLGTATSPPPGPVVILVGAVALAANTASALFLRPHAHDDLATRSALLHLALDAAASGAVVVGGALLWAGVPHVDPILSMVIGVLTIRSALSMLAEAAHLLAEGAPEGASADDVAACLRGVQGVADVHHVHVWSVSSRLRAATAHVVVPDGALSDTLPLLGRMNERLRQTLGITHPTLQLETAACDPPGLLGDPRALAGENEGP